jgi:hypothetical protein
MLICKNTGTIVKYITGELDYTVTYFPSLSGGSFAINTSNFNYFEHEGGDIFVCLFNWPLDELAGSVKPEIASRLYNQNDTALAVRIASAKQYLKLKSKATKFLMGGNTQLGSYDTTFTFKVQMEVYIKLEEIHRTICNGLLPDCSNVDFQILSIKRDWVAAE